MIQTHGSCLTPFNTVTLRLRLFMCALALLCTPVWASDKPSEVHILVDVSGSMKKTDPNNLRKPALDMLSELLPSGSKSGIWAFGREINMMLAPAQVDANWRTKAKRTAAAMRSVGLNTNVTDALAAGLYQNKNADADAFEQHVILITDGKIDMAQEGDPSAPENAAAKRRLLGTILPKYSTQNVKLHTLALSDQADRALLQQLSLATGGLFVQVAEAKDLLPAFLSLFDRAVPTEQAPLIDNHFVIDDSVREFTALMFRTEDAGPSTLVMPNGDKLTRSRAAKDDGVRWHNDIHFDLVTVTSPPAGRWGIQGRLDPNNRIQILTDLSLDVSGVPNSLFAGDPINLSVMLTEQGEAITEPALLGLTDISLKVTAPDGRTGSKLLSDPEQLPSDGRFNETMGKLNQFGEYHFEITAQGRTFERRQSVSATLLQPMNIATEEVLAEQTLYVRVKPSSEYLDVKLSRVIARIEAPDASSDIRPLSFNDDKGEWQLALKAQKGDGQYNVQLNVRGVSTTGAMFKSKPEAIAVTFPLRDLASTRQDGEAPVAASESLADSAPSSSDNGTQETLAPNLAEKFQQQSTSPNPESDEQPSQEPSLEPDTSVEDDEFADTDDDSSSWWWIAILVVVLLGALGGGGFWWWRKKQTTKPVAATAPVAKGSLREDDDPADNQNVAGDFDEFSGEDEEPIHNSVDASGDVPVLDADDQVEEGASVQDIPTLADTAGETEAQSEGVDAPPGSVLNEMVADDSSSNDSSESNGDEPATQDEPSPSSESEMSEEELAAAQWAEMAAEEESSAETQSSDEAVSNTSEDTDGDDSAMSEEELAASQWAEMAAAEEEANDGEAENTGNDDSGMSEEELAAAQWAEMAAEEENESAPEEQDTAEEPAASDTAESAGEGDDPYAGMSDDERMAAEWSAAMDADDEVSDANEDDDASEENEDDAEILDESFNIDPESSADSDDWGEFDIEKQLDKDK